MLVRAANQDMSADKTHDTTTVPHTETLGVPSGQAKSVVPEVPISRQVTCKLNIPSKRSGLAHVTSESELSTCYDGPRRPRGNKAEAQWHFSKSGLQMTNGANSPEAEAVIKRAPSTSSISGVSRYPDLCFEPNVKTRVKLTWDDAPKSCLLIKKRADPEVTADCITLAKWLQDERGIRVLVEPAAQGDLPMFDTFSMCATLEEGQEGDPSDVDDLSAAVDFVICVGGDGTLLHLNGLFMGSRPVPPVIAYNRGSMGFLTPFVFEHYKESLTAMFDGQLTLTLRRRLVFSCYVKDEAVGMSNVPPCENAHEGLALNEIVINRGPHPYMVSLELYVNDMAITTILADGVIVSTATGSTAYSLSAGGPMCHPLLPGMLLTPIAPHSLSTRPLVLPDNCEIKLKVSNDSRVSAYAYYDGLGPVELHQNDYVLVRLSKRPVPCVNRTDEITDWFSSLASCLHWNSRHPQVSLPDPVFAHPAPTPVPGARPRPGQSPDPFSRRRTRQPKA